MTDDNRAANLSIESLDEVLIGMSEVLRSLGVTAHEHVTYEWNGYRYSSAADAIAAAKRALR